MRDVLLKAAADLYRVIWMDQAEEVGMPAPSFDSIEVPAKRVEDLLIFISNFVGRLEQAWGFDLETIFDKAGIDDSDTKADLIYYAGMGTQGHGVGLWDSPWDGYLEKAESKLGKTFDPAPFYDEFDSLRDMAWIDYQKWLEENCDDSSKGKFKKGDFVKFNTSFGTGDKLSGQGEVVGLFTDHFDGLTQRLRYVVRVVKAPYRIGQLITVMDDELRRSRNV